MLLPVLALGVLQAADPPAWAVPTFESLGIYYNRPKAQSRLSVRYRANGEDWKEGYGLVYDDREKQYRGSLVGLKPDTAYDIKVDELQFSARTRSEQFPIGKTTFVDGTTDQTLHIREAGTPNAWHLVTPKPGTKFLSDVFNMSDYNVVVEAGYVI